MSTQEEQTYSYKLFFEYLLNNKSDDDIKQASEYKTTKSEKELSFDFSQLLSHRNIPINEETVKFHLFYFLNTHDVYTKKTLFDSIVSIFMGNPEDYVKILKKNGDKSNELEKYVKKKVKQRDDLLKLPIIKKSKYVDQQLEEILKKTYDPKRIKEWINLSIEDFNFSKYDFFKE